MIAKAKEIDVNYISLKLVAYIGTVHLSIEIPRDESIRFVEQHGGDVHVISNPRRWSCLRQRHQNTGLVGGLDRPAILTCLRHREQVEHPMMVKWVIEVAA